jgi:hypothetical protein
MGNRLITWLHQYGLSTCWERRLWSTAVMGMVSMDVYLACEKVSDVLVGNVVVPTYKSTYTPSAWAAATGECTP